MNDERQARWAAEAATVARSLSRVADLATVLDPGPDTDDVESFNAWAGRLHAWSVEVAGGIDRPALSEELQRRQQAFLDWRDLHERVRSRFRLEDS